MLLSASVATVHCCNYQSCSQVCYCEVHVTLGISSITVVLQIDMECRHYYINTNTTKSTGTFLHTNITATARSAW